MPTFFDIQFIARELAEGKLLICSNQRLSSRLQSAFADYWQQRGQAVVDAPRVYSLEGWLQHSWNTLLLEAHPLAVTHTILTKPQEQLLWEQIVLDSGLPLLRPAATAQQAASAYKTLIQWRKNILDTDVRALFLNDEDSSTFIGWADEFDSLCSSNGYIPAVKIAEYLLSLYEAGDIDRQEPFLLVGFESLNPLDTALLQSVGPLEHYIPDTGAALFKTVACESTQQELLAAAIWAKQQLKNKPEQTVAIVIPDLAQQRARVQRIFQEVFEPDFFDCANARQSLSFNLSAGYPLIEAPVISAAMDILSLYLPVIESELCLTVVASPFYTLAEGDEQSISSLARLIYDLRDTHISAATFRQLAEKVSTKLSDKPWHFSGCLLRQATLLRNGDKYRTPAQWGEFFSDMLAIIDWPGIRSLDSHEYQQVSQWHDLLESLAALDSIVGKVDYQKAVSLLTGLLSRQPFQAETSDSSLQLLGTLEAAGLQFDHLWLTSMSEQHWPGRPSPNPLLPYAMQRDCDMPHATADRELQFSRNLMERFALSAGNIIASFTHQHEGNTTAPSPLLATSPTIGLDELLGKSMESLTPLLEIRRRYMDSTCLEVFEPGSAPVLTDQEQVRGGSSLFASQSACPFRAFSRHRLQLQKLPVPEIGLNAAERGTLLHRALEIIWIKLKDRDTLLSLDKNAQLELCASAADYTLKEFESRNPTAIGARFRSLEQQRIASLLHGWLDTEKERADFSVKALEARHTFRFAQLELETRIDRIDKLADGSLLIIDYKTGKKTEIQRWWGSRPDEPQLPLYHMLLGNTDEVGGIAFARVHIDGHKLLGVGNENSPETKIRFQDKYKSRAAVENWQQLQSQWQRVLTTLAEDFIAGTATVDPKNKSATCTYCDFSSVCRINSLPLDVPFDASH